MIVCEEQIHLYLDVLGQRFAAGFMSNGPSEAIMEPEREWGLNGNGGLDFLPCTFQLNLGRCWRYEAF